MIPTFCERSSLALLSPLQRDTPTTTATDTGSTPPTTPFVLGAPLVTTTTRYQDLAGYSSHGSWECCSCHCFSSTGFEVCTNFRSQHPAFWMDVRDPFYVCYDCYDNSSQVVTMQDLKICEDAHASALAAHSPDASKLTTDRFASAAWRNSLDDTTDGVATNLADRFNECVSYLNDNVFNIDDKQLVRLDKPKAPEWDKLCKIHGIFDLQKWTAKKVDALFTDVATSHGLRPDWHRPTEFRADTSVLITAIEKTMNDFTKENLAVYITETSKLIGAKHVGTLHGFYLCHLGCLS